MVNSSIESVSRRTEEWTSFVWNFSTGASPWRTESPTFFLHDNRECNLVLKGTYTNNCVSRVEYKLNLKLAFSPAHTGYFDETFEARLVLDRFEYKFKLGKLTDREFAEEILMQHHVSLSSRRKVRARVELLCRTRHDGKDYCRLPFDNDVAALSRDLDYLLDSGYQSDLDVEVGGEKFAAHRAVLACRSNVLAKAIEHDMLERRTGRIVLQGWDPRAARRVLGYIYTGKYDLSRDSVCEVFRLAHFLELHDLQIQCKLYVLLNLSVDSIADALRLTYHDQYDMADVREAALSFIATNEAECAANPDLLDSLCRSLDLQSVGFVLGFADRHNLEKTLLAVIDFVKRNFGRLSQEVTSYLVSKPPLMSKMLELPESIVDNDYDCDYEYDGDGDDDDDDDKR